MLVVALTGGIGSGKTTVAKIFASKGITVIDTDQLSRDVTEPGQPALAAIVKEFGDDILLKNGSLNRYKLRKIIFTKPAQRLWLEKLLHPLIRQEMKRHIEAATSPYCIVIIPLLFETEPNPLIDRVLVVDATEEQQLHRAKIRDKLSAADIEGILKAQINRNKRLTDADDIIYNDGDMEDLIPQVENLHKTYLEIAR